MRIIILTIFAICMAGTVKAQTEFNFSCYDEEIAAIPDALYDDDYDPSDDYDRVAYLNSIITPDGFSINADSETVRVFTGNDPKNGSQEWYHTGFDIYPYDEWNIIYRAVHRVLINLKYGYEANTGTGL